MMLEDLEGQLQESTQQQEEAEAELEAVRAQLRQAQGAAAAAAGAVGVGAIGVAAAANVASSRKVCVAVLCCAPGGRTHAVVCGPQSLLCFLSPLPLVARLSRSGFSLALLAAAAAKCSLLQCTA